MKVRNAQYCDKRGNITEQLEYFDSNLGRWRKVETVWATPQDEQRFNNAVEEEYRAAVLYSSGR